MRAPAVPGRLPSDAVRHPGDLEGARAQRRCLDGVLRRGDEVAAEAARRPDCDRTGRPGHQGSIAAAYAVLSAQDPSDLETLDHLTACADAVAEVAEGFALLTPAARSMLVATHRALRQMPAMCTQSSTLDELSARRLGGARQLAEDEDARLVIGIEVARAVLETAWQVNGVQPDRDGRGESTPAPRAPSAASRVVGAVITGTIMGALTDPRTDRRPSDRPVVVRRALEVGLADGLRHVVAVAITTRFARQATVRRA